MIHGRIYQDLLGQCKPYQAEVPWSPSYADVDLWAPPSEAETMSSLRDTYPEKALIASGVVIRHHGKQLILNPILTEPLGIILPLRLELNKRPFDLLTPQGTVSKTLPVCAALRDGSIKAAIKNTHALLLTFTTECLAALRWAGLPATTAFGLTRLSPKDVADFCNCLGLNPGDAQANEGTRLVVVNWTPSHTDRNELEALGQVREQVRILENYLRMSLDMYVWTPPAEDVARIRTCCSHGSPEQVRQAILDSMDASLVPAAMSDDEINRPKDLPEAIAKLRQALQRSPGNRKRERRLWAEYDAKLNDDLITPLTKRALEMLNPEERNRLFAIAGISRIAFPATEALSAKFARGIARAGIRETGVAITPEIELLLKSYSLLLNLIKAGK
jgi:hypothetical protein